MSKEPKIHFDLDLIDQECGVASANECTGLVQIPPENEWEDESYNQIYKLSGVDKKKKQEIKQDYSGDNPEGSVF